MKVVVMGIIIIDIVLLIIWLYAVHPFLQIHCTALWLDFALDTDTALWLMWDFCAETFYSKLTISYRINFYSPAIRKSTKSSFADKYKIREFSQPTDLSSSTFFLHIPINHHLMPWHATLFAVIPYNIATIIYRKPLSTSNTYDWMFA